MVSGSIYEDENAVFLKMITGSTYKNELMQKLGEMFPNFVAPLRRIGLRFLE